MKQIQKERYSQPSPPHGQGIRFRDDTISQCEWDAFENLDIVSFLPYGQSRDTFDEDIWRRVSCWYRFSRVLN